MQTKAISFVAALALVGCATVTTHSSTAPGADLARYRTFGFYEGQGPQSIAQQEVRASLERNLAAKGLARAQPGEQPDFLIAVQGKQQQKVVSYSGYRGFGWYGAYPDVTTYDEGTLIVDFVDARTGQAFWRGTASAVLEHPNNPDPSKIDQAVSKLVQRYPVQLASAPRPAM